MHRRVVDLGGRLEAMRGQFDGAEVIAIHDDAPGVAFLTADGEFETELAAQPPLTTVVTGEAQAPARDILVEQFHALLGAMLLGQQQRPLAHAMGAPPPGCGGAQQEHDEKVTQGHERNPV